jgi:hypothetical protein
MAPADPEAPAAPATPALPSAPAAAAPPFPLLEAHPVINKAAIKTRTQVRMTVKTSDAASAGTARPR